MKKGSICKGSVEYVDFPGKGMVKLDEEYGTDIPALVKDVLPGQRVTVRIKKKKHDIYEAMLISVDEKAPNEIEAPCPHFGTCGGCTYQNLSYPDQIKLKDSQMRRIFKDYLYCYEGTYESPVNEAYRNKMEFSFGDGCKGGELELGLHKQGSFYDILSVKECRIVDEDYRKILSETLGYFRGKGCTYFHKITHEGFLRHLLVRKAVRTGEILICLVTSSDIPADTPCTEVSIIDDWKEAMLALDLKGRIAGVLHIINDSLSDVVKSDETRVLFGQDYFYEELMGLKFKISPFSFFQTNSLSAEIIYGTVREYIGDNLGDKADKTVFDLYSGTGTIAQMIAPVAGKVIGIEIVEEAVEAAKENAKLNGLDNCEFIAGDVLKKLDEITDRPDYIILDPPRDGVNPKALRKIIDYGVDNIIYIACKPTSLARDLEIFTAYGYKPVRMRAVDQFPGTVHVEVVSLLQRVSNTRERTITLDVEMEDYHRIKNGTGVTADATD